MLIDCIVKCKVHSVLWQFQPGGVNLKIYLGKSENELLFLYALVFPDIFLLFVCSKGALIDCLQYEEFTLSFRSLKGGG